MRAQEVTIQYNLCNEPWLKYSMAAVADRGLKPSQWTSARLHKEVIYLETQKQRYELSRVESPSTTGAEPPPPVCNPSLTAEWRWQCSTRGTLRFQQDVLPVKGCMHARYIRAVVELFGARLLL